MSILLKFRVGFVLSLFIFFQAQSQYQYVPFDMPRPSPSCSITQRVGITDIAIHYSSPDIRGRKVWGELVPLNEGKPFPWRAGANETTTISFTDEVNIEGNKLAPGTYGLFAIPAEKKWMIILSKDSETWGSFYYQEANDVLRIEVEPKQTDFQEYLKYDIDQLSDSSAIISLKWEKVKISFSIEVDVKRVVFQHLTREMSSRYASSWQTPFYAAHYCYTNNVHLDQALQWIDQSIRLGPNFLNYRYKSLILGALDRKKESEEVMEYALNNIANVEELHAYGLSLLSRKKIHEAFHVFTVNAAAHPKVFIVNVDLARAYSALGKYKDALKFVQLALKGNPDEQTKRFLEESMPTYHR